MQVDTVTSYYHRFLKQLERQDVLISDELEYVPFSRMAAEYRAKTSMKEEKI